MNGAIAMHGILSVLNAFALQRQHAQYAKRDQHQSNQHFNQTKTLVVTQALLLLHIQPILGGAAFNNQL